MKILIDSNVLLWLVYSPSRIGPKTTSFIKEAENTCVSCVSLWELAIKFNIGKLPHSPKIISNEVGQAGLEIMPLNQRHIERLTQIKLPQKDPFDRMLLAQSESEAYIFLTADKQILNSPYNTLNISA